MVKARWELPSCSPPLCRYSIGFTPRNTSIMSLSKETLPPASGLFPMEQRYYNESKSQLVTLISFASILLKSYICIKLIKYSVMVKRLYKDPSRRGMILDDRCQIFNRYESPCGSCKHYQADDYYCRHIPMEFPMNFCRGKSNIIK